jgi:hypothetical protein
MPHARTPVPPSSDTLGERDDALLVEEQRFAIVPEWVIDAELSDAAFRLYSLLLRYGATSGQRMPSRRTLAERLHRSVDSVDRAMRELQSHRIVRVEHRQRGGEHLTNRYHVRTSNPAHDRGLPSDPNPAHRPAAVPEEGGRRSAATRIRAARVAAEVRPDREQLTDTPPPPAPSRRQSSPARTREKEATAVGQADRRTELLGACGITDVDVLVERCQASRRALGQPTGRWTRGCLLAAIQLAHTRGWPGGSIGSALLAVAADPATRSPMRVAEAGPWWDQTQPVGPTVDDDARDVDDLEAELDAVAGRRPALQAMARAELTAEQLPLTRATVIRRASEILHRTQGGDAA